MTMPSGRNITVNWNHSHAGWKQHLRTVKRIMWWHQVRTFMDTGSNQWIHHSYRIMVCSRNDAGIAFMLMLSLRTWKRIMIWMNWNHRNATRSCSHWEHYSVIGMRCCNGLLIWCHINHQESIHWFQWEHQWVEGFVWFLFESTE